VDAWVDEQPAALAHAAPASPASSQEEGPAGKQGAVGSPAVLHMTVRDTGIGISHESISRLFQCFRQANESMSRRYGGTGTCSTYTTRSARRPACADCQVVNQLGTA
jgi:hypothetical protein